jgi:hypothetical protein
MRTFDEEFPLKLIFNIHNIVIIQIFRAACASSYCTLGTINGRVRKTPKTFIVQILTHVN